jgi:hypothetical protein
VDPDRGGKCHNDAYRIGVAAEARTPGPAVPGSQHPGLPVQLVIGVYQRKTILTVLARAADDWLARRRPPLELTLPQPTVNVTSSATGQLYWPKKPANR